MGKKGCNLRNHVNENHPENTALNIVITKDNVTRSNCFAVVVRAAFVRYKNTRGRESTHGTYLYNEGIIV